MTDEVKLSDLDYCYASLEYLKVLEQNSYSRNEYIRDFREKINLKQSTIIGMVALIFPIILWVNFLISVKIVQQNVVSKNFILDYGTNLLGLLMLSAFLFIIVFLFLKNIWQRKLFRPLAKVFEKKLKQRLMINIKPIDENSESIILLSIFQKPRIPEKYLCVEMLPLIIRFFESGQVHMMKEAIYSLELDLQNTGYYQNIIPNHTLLQREKDYLSDRINKLEEMIEVR